MTAAYMALLAQISRAAEKCPIVVKFLAGHFGVEKPVVTIVSGRRHR